MNIFEATTKQLGITEELHQIARKWSNFPSGLISIIGPKDSGKIRLATVIANSIRGKKADLVSWRELTLKLGESTEDATTLNIRPALKQFANSDLLVLYGIDIRKNNFWQEGMLLELLELRGTEPTVLVGTILAHNSRTPFTGRLIEKMMHPYHHVIDFEGYRDCDLTEA